MKYSTFTPAYIIKKHRRKAQALLMVLALTPVVVYQLTLNAGATGSTSWNSDQFPLGTSQNTEIKNGTIGLSLTSSTTESTTEDFSLGDNSVNAFAMAGFPEGGGLSTNKAYSYTNTTNPSVGANVEGLYINGNILYVAGFGGLKVIDTHGTKDPADDTFVNTYTTVSSPSIASNYINKLIFSNNLLYVATYYGGVTVINTQGTLTDASDDTLVTRYTTASNPALASNNIINVIVDENLIYISTYGGGLSVIDTQGTVSASDDALVTRYRTGGVPSLPGGLYPDYMTNAFVSNDVIYASTLGAGLVVINRSGTLDASDDSIVGVYSTSSIPAIPNDTVWEAYVQDELLYVSTQGGLTIINTNGTPELSDDVLVGDYIPQEMTNSDSRVWNSTQIGDFLYLATIEGVIAVDTNGTPLTQSDDTYSRITTRTLPAILANDINYVYATSDTLYIGTDAGGLSVYTPGEYLAASTYYSTARSIASTPTTTITVDTTTASGQAVALAYRTGGADAAWREEFDDLSSYQADPYNWTSTFSTATATVGNLKVRNPVRGRYGYLWVDTGYPNDHFALGSRVTARVRMVDSDNDREYGMTMFNDDYWDEGESDLSDEWSTVTFTAKLKTFSKIGFNVYSLDGNAFGSDTTFEVDWVQVTTSDSMGEWGSWNSCSGSTCILPNLGSDSWIQYKLDLTTDDTSTSPVVNSVSFNGDYQSTGIYISNTETFRKPVNVGVFNAEMETPTGTTVAYEYSIDGGTTWASVSPGENLGSDDIVATSFTWRATLSTSNGAYSPSLESVTLATSPHKTKTGTSAAAQVSLLEKNGDYDAAAVIRAKYPHLFENDAKTEDKQHTIISILNEVIDKLKLLLKLKSN